jgi:hypothetical protein
MYFMALFYSVFRINIHVVYFNTLIIAVKLYVRAALFGFSLD